MTPRERRSLGSIVHAKHYEKAGWTEMIPLAPSAEFEVDRKQSQQQSNVSSLLWADICPVLWIHYTLH